MSPKFKTQSAAAPATKNTALAAAPKGGAIQVSEKFANAIGFLGGIENIDPSGSRQYFGTHGFHGVVKLTNFEVINTEMKGPAFVAEVEIVTNDSGNGVEKVGHRYSIYKPFGQYPKYAKELMVGLVLAFSGVDLHDPDHAENKRQMQATMKAHIQAFTDMDYDNDPHYAYLTVKPTKNEKFPELVFSPVEASEEDGEAAE